MMIEFEVYIDEQLRFFHSGLVILIIFCADRPRLFAAAGGLF